MVSGHPSKGQGNGGANGSDAEVLNDLAKYFSVGEFNLHDRIYLADIRGEIFGYLYLTYSAPFFRRRHFLRAALVRPENSWFELSGVPDNDDNMMGGRGNATASGTRNFVK